MADDVSRNPESQASLADLARTLAQLEGRFEASIAALESATTRTEQASTELEAETRRTAKTPRGVSAAEPAVIQESATAADALAAAERRATAAATERIALEGRERGLVTEIAAAESRVAAAQEAQVAADIERQRAATVYSQTSRQAARDAAVAADATTLSLREQLALLRQQGTALSEAQLRNLQSVAETGALAPRGRQPYERLTGLGLVQGPAESPALTAEGRRTLQTVDPQRIAQLSQQEAQAALGARDETAARAKVARDETTTAQRTLAGLRSELSAVQGALGPTRQLAAESKLEADEAATRVGLGRRIAALLAERQAQLEREAATGGGGRIPPVLPPAPPAPGEPPEPVSGRDYSGVRGPLVIPAPAPPQGTNLLTDPLTKAEKAAQEKAAAIQKNVAAAQELAAAQRGIGTSAEAEARALSLSSQAYTRHGALQTEWLQALARGQVTLRDFGNQMLSTIGKFAGWSAAAASVYGVLAAVQELGKGALDGVSSVDQLHRTIDNLDTGRATQQIAQLAEDTITPLKDAGDAVFLFSRTFHNQDDAVYAASLALKAYKLDGVSLVDQVRAQTAITTQFHLTAQQLGPVYGLLAQGQRQFNARVQEMIPALGGSASVIAATGGNLTEYIKILQLALRTTQLTGPQLATAFRRSPGFIERPKSQQILTALGFDPQEALTHSTAFYEEVLRRAQTFSGEQRRLVGEALFGPLQGAKLQGLFRADPNLLREILGQNVKNAQPLIEEFAKYFDIPRHRVEELGVRLQALGARLEASGLLSSLGVVVTGLDKALGAANSLLQAFDSLPKGVREAVGALAALRLTGAIAGRFPAGPQSGALGQSVASFGAIFNPQRAEKAALEKLLAEESGYYRDEREAASRRAFRLKQSVAASEATIGQLVASGGSDEEIDQAYKRRAALLERQRVAITEQLVADDNITRTERQIAGIKERIAAGATVQQAALAEGVAYTGALERPTAGGVRPVPIAGGGSVTPGGIIVPPGVRAEQQATAGAEQQAAASADELAASSAQQVGFLATMRNSYREVRPAIERQAVAQEAVTAETRSLGEVFNTTAIAARAGGIAANAATVATEGFAAAVQGLSAFLNPWTILLFGLPEILGHFSETANKIKAAGERADQALSDFAKTGNPANLTTFAQSLRDRANRDYNATATGELPGPLGAAGKALSEWKPLGIDLTAGALDTPNKERSQSTDIKGLADYLNTVNGLVRTTAADAKTTLHGREIVYNAYQWATAQITAAIEHNKSLSASQKAKALEGEQKRLAQIFYGYQARIPTVQPIDPRNPFGQFKGENLDQLTGQLQAIADRTKVFGANKSDVQKVATLYEYIVSRFSHDKNPQDLQKILSGQSALQDVVQTFAQDQVNQANKIVVPSVKLAGEQAHAAALQAKARALRGVVALLKAGGNLVPGAAEEVAKLHKELLAELEADERKLSQAERTLADDTTIASRGVIGIVAKVAGDKAAVAKATANANAAKAAVDAVDPKAAAKAADQVESSIKQTIDGYLQKLGSTANSLAGGSGAGATDPFELDRLRRGLAKARAGDNPVAAAQQDIALAYDELRAAKNEKERLQAETDLANAENELSSAQNDVAQARYTYLESTTRDPVQQVNYQIAAARAAIAAAPAGSAAYYTALADLNNRINDKIRAQADLVAAKYKYLESLTTNPLKIDRLDIKAEDAAVAATAPGTAERYNALAARNAARQKYIDDKASERDQTIQFELSMNDITAAEAEKDIKALLRIKGLSYDLRKRLKQELEQIRKSSQDQFSDLNLNSIKLPTPYEIRRAYQAAVSGINVTQHYSTTIQVSDTASANRVGVVMDRYVAGTGKAIQRATAAR